MLIRCGGQVSPSASGETVAVSVAGAAAAAAVGLNWQRNYDDHQESRLKEIEWRDLSEGKKDISK